MKLKPQMAEAVQGCDSAVSCQTYGTGYIRLGCKREHTNHKATFQIKSVHSRKSYSEYKLYPFTDLFSKGYLKNTILVTERGLLPWFAGYLMKGGGAENT